MSVFCQFCDKEMMFEGQATLVEEYITCGAIPCQAKANRNFKDFNDERAQADAEKVKICVFASMDFEDESAWRLIHEDQHPTFLENPQMVSHMLSGGIITVECEDGEISYCAKTAKEVHSDVKKHFADQKASD